VGKTTLARALARRWAVPYVPEGMRERLEGGLDLHGLDHAGIAELVIELWREQRAREAQAITTSGGFVADRSAIDFFAYWVLYRLDGDPERTAAFHGELLAHTRGYDQVLVLPWGALPLQDDGVRSPNGWNQLHLQATLEGLVRRFLPEEQVLWLPPAVQELRDRERWVQARVGTGPA
jgi:predicted ATPase